MKHRFSAATAGIATLAVSAGIMMAGGAAANAAAPKPPWEPDGQAVGTITFYNSAGTIITSGSTSTGPFYAYAVGSKTVRAGDVQADISLATPVVGANPDTWFRDQLTGFTTYPLTSGPATIKALSTSHPVQGGLDTDLTVDQYIAEAPNTSTDPTAQNIYQVRLITANHGGAQTLTYDDADILVNPTAHTWTQVYGGGAVTPAADASALTMAKGVTINYGRKALISTRLRDAVTHKAIAKASVVLYRRIGAAKSYTVFRTFRTTSAGAASITVGPTENTSYQWRYAGTSAHKVVRSAVRLVRVAQTVTIAATPRSTTAEARFRVYGVVSPRENGQRVTLQRLSGKSWRTAGSAKIASQTMPNGKREIGYVVSMKEKKGSYTFRVVRSATRLNATGVSASVRVRVS